MDAIDAPELVIAASDAPASAIWRQNGHRGAIPGQAAPVARYSNKAPRPPYSSTSTVSPVSVKDDRSSLKTDGKSCCEQSFSTTWDLGSQLSLMGGDSVVGFDTGATANPVRFRGSRNRNLLLRKPRFPRVSTYPSRARSKFCDGPLGEVHFAASTTARTAG